MSVERTQETDRFDRPTQHIGRAESVPERQSIEGLLEKNHEGEQILAQKARDLLTNIQRTTEEAGAELEAANFEAKRCEMNHGTAQDALNRARDYLQQIETIGGTIKSAAVESSLDNPSKTTR